MCILCIILLFVLSFSSVCCVCVLFVCWAAFMRNKLYVIVQVLQVLYFSGIVSEYNRKKRHAKIHFTQVNQNSKVNIQEIENTVYCITSPSALITYYYIVHYTPLLNNNSQQNLS